MSLSGDNTAVPSSPAGRLEPVSVTGPGPGSAAQPVPGKSRRRVYTGEALARRQAWGREWGQVGAQWKRENNPKG